MDTQDKKNLSEAKTKNAAVTEKTEKVENTAPVAAATAKHQQNAAKKPAAKSKAADFKRKYFDYYDDVKDHTKGKEDW
ncbi:MAG: hypothetical protein SOX77_02505 [Candidatus Borkfalkiaceae bacterium]|nr:hypothetical protein [Christensenellaceae bacterium]